MLEWARQSGCSWDEDTCACAALGGQLAVLKWAHESDCPWSSFATLHAASSNHLDILKWARQQQPACPWWSLDELDPDEEDDLIDARASTRMPTLS